MTRRRGDTERPHPDYLDTGRDHLLAPRNARTRPLRDAGKRTQETGDPTATNEKGKTMIAENCTPHPPSGFQPFHALGRNGEKEPAPAYHLGPKHRLPGLPSIETLWVEPIGVIARRVDTVEILTRADLHGAMKALLEAYSHAATYTGDTEAPKGWTPVPVFVHSIPTSRTAHWRGPTIEATALPALQLRWTPDDGVLIHRTDTGGSITREDVQGALKGLRALIDEVRG